MDTTLGSVFLAHLGDNHGTVPEDLEQILLRLHETGRVAWPALALDPGVFTRHVAERCAGSPDIGAALRGLHVADFYLACACRNNVGGAIALFDEAFSPTIAASVVRIDRGPALVDEVRQRLFQKLFVVVEEGAKPKIHGYSGSGPLSSWVGIAAQRIAITLLRGSSSQNHAEVDAVVEAIPGTVDPEFEYLKTRYKSEFRAALQAGFVALPQRDRMLLRLSLVNRLSHEKIAAMYKVHQATVSRWIDKARTRVAEEARGHLRRRLKVSTEEFNSLGRMIASQIDLSLSRWLGDVSEGDGEDDGNSD